VPSTVTVGLTLARSDTIHALDGIVRATSRSACGHAKRLSASWRTVCVRLWLSCAKSV
jgi:hypothetical protein